MCTLHGPSYLLPFVTLHVFFFLMLLSPCTSSFVSRFILTLHTSSSSHPFSFSPHPARTILSHSISSPCTYYSFSLYLFTLHTSPSSSPCTLSCPFSSPQYTSLTQYPVTLHWCSPLSPHPRPCVSSVCLSPSMSPTHPLYVYIYVHAILSQWVGGWAVYCVVGILLLCCCLVLFCVEVERGVMCKILREIIICNMARAKVDYCIYVIGFRIQPMHNYIITSLSLWYY